jgi:hypothetical protein
LNELNASIGELLERLNDRVMRHVKQPRQQLLRIPRDREQGSTGW